MTPSNSHRPIPPEPGRWRALSLAALVHLALLGFLWIGVSWQSVKPVAVEAEIWDAEPSVAALPPPPPPPVVSPEPPRPIEPPAAVKPAPEPTKPKISEPDIALEKEKKRKLEQQKAEEQEAKLKKEKQAEAELEAKRKKEKLAEEKAQQRAEEEKRKLAEEQERKKKAEEEAQAAQRAKARHEEDMRRLASEAGTSSGNAERSQGAKADPSYARAVGARIKSNTIWNQDTQGNQPVEYRIELLPDGSVRDVVLVKPSDNSAFDQAVKRAIYRTAPYPIDPTTGRVPSSILVSHRPKDSETR